MYVHMDQSVKTVVDEGLIEKTLKASASWILSAMSNFSNH